MGAASVLVAGRRARVPAPLPVRREQALVLVPRRARGPARRQTVVGTAARVMARVAAARVTARVAAARALRVVLELVLALA